MTWWNQPSLCDRDGIICDGAVRSGKTLALCCGFFLWSMTCFDKSVFAVCGKTVSSLRRNIILQLPQWLGGLLTVTEHRQENKLTVRMGGRVNTYYLFGGQDEGSYMLIQGMTLAGVLLDEAVLMPRSFVEQAAARCSVPGSRLWFSCNPGGQEHWFFREWICKAGEKNMLYLHFTMDDNPGLSADIRARYHRLYTGIFYERYVLGRWCKAEGLVYDFDPERHVGQVAPKPGGRWYISVDYGTRNPFSAGLWYVTNQCKMLNSCHSDTERSGGEESPGARGILRHCVPQDDSVGGKVAIRVAEFYYDGRQKGRMMTDEEYHDALEALAGDRPVEFVVIDPSAASFIALLRKRRRFRVRRANNAVLPGIRLVGSLLQQGRLLFDPSCADTIREFSLYCWEEDHSRDAPRKENDHAMDDIRYFAMTVMK